MRSRVDDFATVTFPGRLVLSGLTFTAGLGAKRMTEILGISCGPEIILTAIVTIFTALAFIAIWYLKDYEDWKASRYDDYIADLKQNGEAAKRPNVVFGRPYMYAMGLSMAITVVMAIIATPYLVELIAGPIDPVNPNLAIFVAVAFFATIVLGFLSDYFIARPVADKSMKARYVEVQEGVIAEITAAFPSTSENAGALNDEQKAKILELLGIN